MYCTQCGTKLPDDTKVCPNCNTSFVPEEEVKAAEPEVQVEAPQAPEMQPQAAPQQEIPQETPQNIPPQMEAQAPQQPQFEQPQMMNGGFDPMTGQPLAPQPPKEKKPLLKNKLFLGLMAGGAALLLAIIIVVIIILQPKKVDVSKYVSISYSGFDGYATAEVYLDEWGLYSEIMHATGKNDFDFSNLDDYTDLLGGGITIASAMDTIEMTLDKDANISNGDVITATITYDNEIAKEVKIKFVGETVSITTGGLEAVEEVNPFEGLNVSFSGVAPYGSVEYEYDGRSEYVETYYFNVSQWDYLKNGDVVTITYDSSDENTMWSGYVATTKEMTYEVSGLQEYVESYADLDEEALTKLKSETEDTITAYAAGNYSNTITMGDLEYAGYIFGYTKYPENWPWATNKLYIIYKSELSDAATGNSRTVYYPVYFRNLMMLDGNLSYEEKCGLEGYSPVEGLYMWSDGYVNPLSAYMDLVTYYEEEYNFECGDGFEAYASYTGVSSLEDISAAYKTALHTDARTKIEKYVDDHYDEKNELDDLELMGEYLLVAKEQGSDFAYNNRYIVVYSGKVTNKDNKFEETTVYFPFVYNGIVALPNNEYMYMECDGLKGWSNRLGDSWYYTDGYLDGAQMFAELVTVNRENYTYVVSEGLKQFGK